MKAIGSLKEDLSIEKRISITPETVKKFVQLNFSIFLEKNFGSHLGIADEEYESKGAKIVNSAKEVIEKLGNHFSVWIFLSINFTMHVNTTIFEAKVV